MSIPPRNEGPSVISMDGTLKPPYDTKYPLYNEYTSDQQH